MKTATLPDRAARVSAVMRDAVVWDNHCCVTFTDMPTWLPELRRYREAGAHLVHLNVGAAHESFEDVIRTSDYIRRWLHGQPEHFALTLTVDDILQAKRDGKLGVCFDVEGAHVVEDDLTRVARLYGLGVRWMAMAYNQRNLVGSGCHDTSDDGLTPFGRRLIEEMDRVGMVKDVAHTGDRTALDVCAASATPVTISHSNPRALTDHPRCVPDALMRACARTGGVLGISGVGLFLGDNDTRSARIAQSIDYAVDVMGIDHVGLGTDHCFMDLAELDGILSTDSPLFPAAHGYRPGVRIARPEQIPEIAEALLQRGYADADVGKVLGGNFLRVARQVWK